MSLTETDQKSRFRDRLTKIRVKSGKSNWKGGAGILPSAWTPPAEREADQEPIRLTSFRENIKYPLSIVGAFGIGLFSVFLIRYVRFHMLGGSLVGTDADLTMVIDASMAACFGFLLRFAFNFIEQEYVLAKAAGIAVMVGAMHNLAHWYPTPMSVIFSPAWVEQTQTQTEGNSILFRGASFVLMEYDDGEPPEPRVFYVD